MRDIYGRERAARMLSYMGMVMALAPTWQWSAPGFLIYGMSAIAIPISNLYIAQAARHDPTRRPDLRSASSWSATSSAAWM